MTFMPPKRAMSASFSADVIMPVPLSQQSVSMLKSSNPALIWPCVFSWRVSIRPKLSYVVSRILDPEFILDHSWKFNGVYSGAITTKFHQNPSDSFCAVLLSKQKWWRFLLAAIKSPFGAVIGSCRPSRPTWLRVCHKVWKNAVPLFLNKEFWALSSHVTEKLFIKCLLS